MNDGAQPVVILDPHEDIVHSLSAGRGGMGDKRGDSSQELLKLLWLQQGQDLVQDV